MDRSEFLLDWIPFWKLVYNTMMAQQNMSGMMLRKDKWKALKESSLIPETTYDRIIIPCLQRSYGFSQNSYCKNRNLVEDFIDQDSYQAFVNSANNLIDAELLQNARIQNLAFFCWTFFFLKISIAVGILSFTFLGSLVYFDFDPSLQTIFVHICVGCIIFSVVIASLSPIHLYSKKFPEYNLDYNIKQQLRKLVDTENAKYKQQNRDYLKWRIQKQFFWIQLEINHALYLQKNPTKSIYRIGEAETYLSL